MSTTLADVAVDVVFDVLVVDKQRVADDVVMLTLRRPDGERLPAWTPGAHIDVLLAGLRTRQYSLCGDPAARQEWRIAVLRDAAGEGTSLYLHDALNVGDTIEVRSPRNHFTFERARSYRFIAGGIGITPIMPMLQAADEVGATWELFYCGRSKTAMAFAENLAGRGDRVRLRAKDEDGPLDLADALAEPAPDTLVYCCGPERLLEAVEQLCAEDWPTGALHVERFDPRPIAEPVRTESFEIVLAESGMTLTVPPDRSILSVVEDVGIRVLTSCEEGTCGTCETAVLDGLPDHRDSVLTDAERAANDCMMICVSRSCTPQLVLEL